MISQMISVGSLERGVGVEEEKKVDGVTGRKGRRRKGEERGRGQEGGREGHRTADWKGEASVFFPAMRWVLGGPKASLERGEQITDDVADPALIKWLIMH